VAKKQQVSVLTNRKIDSISGMGQLYEAYYRAQQKLKTQVWELQQTGAPTNSFEANRLKNIEKQVTGTLNELRSATAMAVPAGVQKVYMSLKQETLNVLPYGLGDQVAGTFGLVDQRRVAIYSDAIIRDIDSALTSTQKAFSSVIMRTSLLGTTDAAISSALQIEQIAGSSVPAMTKVVAGIIQETLGKGEQGFVSVKGKDGVMRRYQLDNYAETVVRTRTREAGTAAVKQTMADAAATLGIAPLIEITRHEDECQVCLDVIEDGDRVIFSLVDGDPEYPWIEDEGEGGPPWHPNCIHVATPYVDVSNLPSSQKEASQNEAIDNSEE
jgi:hypothetical protein